MKDEPPPQQVDRMGSMASLGGASPAGAGVSPVAKPDIINEAHEES